MLDIIYISFFLIGTIGFYLWFWFGSVGILALRKMGGGELPVDARLYYSPQTLYKILETYGEKGRSTFRTMLLADMVFPAVYVPTIGLMADKLATANMMPQYLFFYTYAAAILGGIFDYIENYALLKILSDYPTHHKKLATIAAIATLLKMVLTTTAIILPIFDVIVIF